MTVARVRAEIEAFATGRRLALRAETVLGTLAGASGSVIFGCEGGSKIVAKGTRNQKGLIAEHVVARLGQLLAAPVGDVVLVDVPEALRSDPAVASMGMGLAHGTKFIDNLTNREAIAYTDIPANRMRFARLCTLYSLASAADWQLFYTTTDRVVYSLDHGHFFPGGPQWTAASLRAAPPVTIDPWFAAANLTNVELSESRSLLEAITDVDLTAVLAGPPPDWPFEADERHALYDFLRARRDGLLAALPAA